MTLFDLIKKYGKGKGDGSMLESVRLLSDEIESIATDDRKDSIMKKMYTIMQGTNYDEYFAQKQIEQMYYIDKEGREHLAPFLTDDKVRYFYDKYDSKIPAGYNFWDFVVAINMMWTDFNTLLRGWFEGASDDELKEKAAELAVTWLDDPDSPFDKNKVWQYFNH